MRSSAYGDLIRGAITSTVISKRRKAVPDRAIQYQNDLIGWSVDVLGDKQESFVWSDYPGYKGHKWDGTPDPLVVCSEALEDWRDVAIEGATGTSKTWFAARALLWFLDVFHNAEVVTAAPKEAQLALHLWAEISKVWERFKTVRPRSQLLGSLQIRMSPPSDYWTAVGFPVGVGASEVSATKAQGFHSEHLLIITEETPGIHGAIMTAFSNTRVAPHNLHLGLGNPDSVTDQLHKFGELESTDLVRISAYDFPNVVLNDASIIPGAASRTGNERRQKSLGEESRLYKSRVRGICPAESADALIRLQWIRDAFNRNPKEVEDLPGALGVDVANSEAGDLGAIVRGEGATVREIIAKQVPNANVFGMEVTILAALYGIAAGNVGIDSVGVGAGAVNEAERLKWYVQAINSGERPIETDDEEKFFNIRSQILWQARRDLENGDIAIDLDERSREAILLIDDLIEPTWTTRNGKIIVEEKEKIKKRLGRSTDVGDAFVIWNWVRQVWDATGFGDAAVGF